VRKRGALFTKLLLTLFFVSNFSFASSVVSSDGSSTQKAEIKPASYFLQKTQGGDGCDTKVTGLDKSKKIKFADPYNSWKKINVNAGYFTGKISGQEAKFYCIDIANEIAFYRNDNPHTYTADGQTPSKITYILNNYVPYKSYPYSGSLSDESKEAAAVQAAIWHFSDGVDVTTIENNTTIKNRAIEIVADADANAGNSTPVPTLAIIPPIQYKNLGEDASFTVEALDEDNTPINNLSIDLSATAGTLSSTTVVTDATGVAGPVTLTPEDNIYTSTITATAEVTIPQGTRYVHCIEPDTYQKLVLATPTTADKSVEGIVNWSQNSQGECDLTGFTTFTQGGWGSSSNSVPGQIRDNNFANVFPSGMVIGIGNTITLTSALAVKDFLPQGGSSSALSQSYTDPTSKISVFAGQVAALKLNVEFDAAGVLGNNNRELKDLVITTGPLANKTVEELLELADTTLGGGSTSFSISDLNDAATAVNENFDNGSVDEGYLTCAPELDKITPILECVVKNNDNTYTAHFGYLNSNDVEVTISVGSDNKFSPAPEDRGQTTTFNPGRTDYYPNADFTVTWDGSSDLVWTLNGKTATASINDSSQVCSEHIYFDKKWFDENGDETDVPDDLPGNYKITVTSDFGTAVGEYDTNGDLIFTYNNPGFDNDGLWVPVNGEYTVEEQNLPTGFISLEGVGTFTAEVPGGYATNPYNDDDKYGLHIIENGKDPNACTTSWLLDLGADVEYCEHNEVDVTVNTSIDVTPDPSRARVVTGWQILNPQDDNTDNSVHYEQFWISGDTSFSITGQWPGVSPTDTLVELEFFVKVYDCNDNQLGEEVTKKYSWDPNVCDPPDPEEADLSLVKTVDNNNPEDGDQVTFTIEVTNSGPQKATGVKVQDFLPEGLNFISASPSNEYDDNTGIWTIGEIASGATKSLTITVLVDVETANTTTLNIGPAKGFNVFVLNDITMPSSDTEGKMAVGRNAYLSNYSLGDQLSTTGEDVLIVDNNLTYESGRVFNGNVVYGNSTNLPINLVSIDGDLKNGKPIDFASADTYLKNLSNEIKNKATTGTTKFEYSQLFLEGTDPFLNVFLVDAEDLENATSLVVDYPDGSVVLINIDGQTVDDWSGGIHLNGQTGNVQDGCENLIYNFYNAKNLVINQVGVAGTILAPYADVNMIGGVQSGQMICKNLEGSGGAQFNICDFIGNIPVDTTLVNVAEIFSSDLDDPDSTPNNGDDEEDDYGTAIVAIGNTGTGGSSGSGGSSGDSGSSQEWNSAGSFGLSEIVYSLSNDIDENILAGTWGGNIYRSTDDGETWTKINDGMNAAFIWSIFTDETTGNIYVGTEQGLFFSNDNGSTWTLTSLTGYDVRGIAVAPDGDVYAGTWGTGVFKSTDGGSTWTDVSNGLDILAINDLVINSSGDIFVATVGGGIYKSTDGGSNWSQLNVGYAYIWTLAITSNDEIYAGTYGDGVYYSDDNGASWYKSNYGLPALYVYSLSIDSDDNAYISTWANGVYTTNDGGLSWSTAGLAGTEVSSILLNKETGTLYAGTSSGQILKTDFEAITDVENTEELPTEFELSQNYPNPFNPSTTIKFKLKENGRFTLKIYNILGQVVTTLLDEEMIAGSHQITFNAANFASGIYIYQLAGDNVNLVKKMVLLR
jgi:choice-of-anchor A domain-containing protein/uncharacterized repeat protein (TIGR01451 family)/TQXA domain-containing protein